jgi:hypothetical protein
MAESTGSTRTNGPAKPRSTGDQTAATKRTTARSTGGSTTAKPRSTAGRTAATKRSTTAKKAATTRTRQQGAAARKRTERKASTRATQAERAVQSQAAEARAEARNGIEQVGETVEKVVLASVGAALVARDNVIGTVEELRAKYSTPAKAQRQLNRFERRGLTARNRVERDLKRTRTRVERELRQRRARVEREVRKQTKPVASQAGLVGARVENVVQGGILAGAQIATRVQEQVAKVA